MIFRTGVAGREAQVHWIGGTPPPAPRLRVDDHSRQGVVLYWDSSSGTVPDLVTQRMDFEGYQVWRAANWTRPLGTSIENGPPSELWGVLYQADRIDNIGADVGLGTLTVAGFQAASAPT